MKALRNFAICLIMVLSLVPLKSAYALTQVEIDNVKATSLTWFKVQSKTNVNQYYYVFCNVDVPIEYKSFGTWNGVALKNSTSASVVHTNYYTSDGGVTWVQQASKNMTVGGYGTPYDTTTDFIVISASKRIANTIGGGDYYNPQPFPTDIKILLPNSSPYKDTTDSFNLWVWYKYPVNTDATSIHLKVSSPTITETNWITTGHEYNRATGEGILKVSAHNVAVGNHDITFEADGIIKTVQFQRLGGIVDENNDGIDDRTNLPNDNGHAPTVPDEDFIKNSIGTMKNFITEFQGFQLFITSFLGVFPSWITLPIATLFTVLVIMTIVKIIRG